MARINNIVKLYPQSLEDEAIRLLSRRLDFVRKMQSGRLTDQQILSIEAKLTADLLDIAKQYDL